jgi:hypothetical protein
VGIRIVPGGVQIVPKALLDTLHRDLQQILEKPLDVDYEDTPLGEILKDLSVTVKATIVVSPAVSSRIKWTKQHFVFTKTLKLSYVLRLVMDSYELKQARVAYGLIVLSPD